MELRIFDSYELPNTLEECELLGQGSFGEVRKALHPSLGDVALKLFQLTGDCKEVQRQKKEFENEAKILQRMNHPNIVQFYGIVSIFSHEGIVMEYMAGKNLQSLIESKKKNDWAWSERHRLLCQLAEAIGYLHTHDKTKAYIHGDIKPENILMSSSMQLKLADFGSANIRDKTECIPSLVVPHSKQHTWPYTAPEFLKDLFMEKSTAMDIYSFGVVMYEILTKQRAYSDAKVGSEVVCLLIISKMERPNAAPLNEIETELKKTPCEDLKNFDKLRKLMQQCWQQDPSKRPNITKILRKLSDDKCEAHDDGNISLGILEDTLPPYPPPKPPMRQASDVNWGFFHSPNLKIVNTKINKKVSLVKGDITKQKVHAIVNCTNTTLHPGGGLHVDDVIHAAAGPELLKECIKLGGCKVGEAKITLAYKLPSKHVIHTVGPIGMNVRALDSCYLNCLNLLRLNKLKSIAFPCISAGFHGYPNSEAAKIALLSVRKWLEQHHTTVDRIIFCIFNNLDLVIYEELFKTYFPK
uniref:Protein kinase domain-containing protein n=1 Tax=Ciona savignyi TaxID=51511 RepID=H2Z9C2_CIOSA